jgi:hypothetical protein
MSRPKGSKNRTPEELVERAELLIQKAKILQELKELGGPKRRKEEADDR